MQDAEKSARYAARAYDLSRSLQLGDLNSRHHRAALLQMATALRKKGELGDAHDYCSVKKNLNLDCPSYIARVISGACKKLYFEAAFFMGKYLLMAKVEWKNSVCCSSTNNNIFIKSDLFNYYLLLRPIYNLFANDL